MGNSYQLDPSDLGCKTSYFEWDNCFTCPLPQCIHDVGDSVKNERSKLRKRLTIWNKIEPLGQLPARGIQKHVREFASQEKITMRTAWRWLKRYHEAEGNRNKFLSGE